LEKKNELLTKGSGVKQKRKSREDRHVFSCIRTEGKLLYRELTFYFYRREIGRKERKKKRERKEDEARERVEKKEGKGRGDRYNPLTGRYCTTEKVSLRIKKKSFELFTINSCREEGGRAAMPIRFEAPRGVRKRSWTREIQDLHSETVDLKIVVNRTKKENWLDQVSRTKQRRPKEERLEELFVCVNCERRGDLATRESPGRAHGREDKKKKLQKNVNGGHSIATAGKILSRSAGKKKNTTRQR